MAKINILLSIDDEDALKFKELQREYKKDGKLVSLLFREMMNLFIQNKKDK